MKREPEQSLDVARCPSPEDVVASVLEPESSVAAEQIRRHVARCAKCRALIEDGQTVVGRLRQAGDTSVSRDLVPDILARIPDSAWRKPTREAAGIGLVYRFPFWLPVGIAAAALLVLGAALAMRHGGSRAADEAVPTVTQADAVGKGIEWLLTRQTSSGGWNAEALGGKPEYAPALNGLAVLALTRSDGAVARLTAPLTRAAAFLLRQQDANGRFGQDFDGAMYNHGIATLALLETFCVTRDPALQTPIENALAFMRARQSPAGGWGYRDTDNAQPNTSITAWQVQALLLADRLEWPGNRAPLRNALAWLSGTVNGSGYFGYEHSQQFPDGPRTLTMMGAHCLLAAKRLDIPVDPALLARVTHGIGKLAGEKPDDYYEAYFYASTLSEVDPTTYKDALAAARSTVVAQQQATGDNAGTWPANHDRWGSAGGRLYSTPMAMLALTPR